MVDCREGEIDVAWVWLSLSMEDYPLRRFLCIFCDLKLIFLEQYPQIIGSILYISAIRLNSLYLRNIQCDLIVLFLLQVVRNLKQKLMTMNEL